MSMLRGRPSSGKLPIAQGWSSGSLGRSGSGSSLNKPFPSGRGNASTLLKEKEEVLGIKQQYKMMKEWHRILRTSADENTIRDSLPREVHIDWKPKVPRHVREEHEESRADPMFWRPRLNVLEVETTGRVTRPHTAEPRVIQSLPAINASKLSPKGNNFLLEPLPAVAPLVMKGRNIGPIVPIQSERHPMNLNRPPSINTDMGPRNDNSAEMRRPRAHGMGLAPLERVTTPSARTRDQPSPLNRDSPFSKSTDRSYSSRQKNQRDLRRQPPTPINTRRSPQTMIEDRDSQSNSLLSPHIMEEASRRIRNRPMTAQGLMTRTQNPERLPEVPPR